MQKKNAAKVWSFTKPGGGAPRVIKNQTPFLEKYFFSELENMDLQNMFYTWSYLQPLKYFADIENVLLSRDSDSTLNFKMMLF